MAAAAMAAAAAAAAATTSVIFLGRTGFQQLRAEKRQLFLRSYRFSRKESTPARHLWYRLRSAAKGLRRSFRRRFGRISGRIPRATVCAGGC